MYTSVKIPDTLQAPPTKNAIEGIAKNNAMSRFDSDIVWSTYTYRDKSSLSGTTVVKLNKTAKNNGKSV